MEHMICKGYVLAYQYNPDTDEYECNIVNAPFDVNYYAEDRDEAETILERATGWSYYDEDDLDDLPF